MNGKGDMAQNKLSVTLDGPGIGREGILFSEFAAAVEGVQDALRLMVQHLGQRQTNRGQPPRWVRNESSFRFTGISYGSFSAELALEPPPSGQASLEELGAAALTALMDWDGSEESTLPPVVTARLHEIYSSVRESVQVWYGEPDHPRKVSVTRRKAPVSATSGQTDALLYGWLYEVNWDKRTAQLHGYRGEYVILRFPAELSQDMLRLATQYVELRGSGRINANDRWTSVYVREINATRSWNKPFDVDEFLNDPNPKVFDPEKIVTASEPFDVDEFLRFIHRARDDGDA